MKKLLVACDQYAYRFEGNYYLKEFGVNLVKRYLHVFDQVSFLVRTKEVNSLMELGIHNIPIHDDRITIIPVPFFQGPREYLKTYFSVIKKVRYSVKGHDAAIYRVPSTIAFEALRVTKKNNIPYAVEVVANPKEALGNTSNIINKLLTFIIYKQLKSACKYADGASYVTEYTLQKIYPASKNGHFESFYSSVELEPSFYASPRKFPRDKTFVICHVASHIKTYDKGHLTVIHVVKELTSKGYDVMAKFAGEGEMIQYYKDVSDELGVSEKIEFAGFLNHDDLRKFLLSADILLFPSKSEGLPRAIIEGMAVGLPCLSSDVGGTVELLPDNLLFNYDDITGFTNRISEIIDTPEIYEKLSDANYNKAKEFSIDELKPRRNDFYEKLYNLVEK